MKKIYITIVAILVALSAFSQDDLFYISYGPSIPLGKTSDYTEKMSWRGFGFGYSQFVNENIAVGFDISWSTYDELLKDETLEYNNLTITGTQYRYINTVPVHATIQYYMGDEYLKYFVGFGIGTSWTEKITDIGAYSILNSEWQFSFAPEVGVMYSVSEKVYPFFKVKYYYSTKNKDFESVSHLNFIVGFAFN